MATMERGPITYAGPVEDYSEKKQPITHTTPITPTEDDLEKGDESDANSHEHWQPGFFAQFPWLGLGALGGVILCLVASVLVLVFSNNQTQTRTLDHRPWPKAVAPNVLISIFNSVANICFGIAISRATLNFPVNSATNNSQATASQSHGGAERLREAQSRI